MSNSKLFGFQRHTSEAISLDSASEVLDLCFGIANGSLEKGRDWKEVPFTRLSLFKAPTILFSQPTAKPVPAKRCSADIPAAVALFTMVTNFSKQPIELDALPRPFCLATREAFYPMARCDSIDPGETVTVWYEIPAWDVYREWMIIQTMKEDHKDPHIFFGLEDLQEILVDALECAFEERDAFLKEHADDPGKIGAKYRWEDYTDRYRYVYPNGNHFHINSLCNPAGGGERIRIVDAYKAGYRTCSLCGMGDWWREMPHEFDHSGDMFWLMTPAGERVAAWVSPNYADDDMEVDSSDMAQVYGDNWLMKLNHVRYGELYVRSFIGNYMICDSGKGASQHSPAQYRIPFVLEEEGVALDECPDVVSADEVTIVESRLP